MDINDCFQNFLDDSRIDYSDTHTIIAYTDEAYKDFKHYAITHGFDEQTARDYFYNVVVSYCKESLIDEKLEAIKDDFND